MDTGKSGQIVISREVARALRTKRPLVALESTLISHGLPYPHNLALAGELEDIIRRQMVTPATIAILDGRPHVGLQGDQLARLAAGNDIRKISLRDFGVAIAQHASGGTTVAATMLVAHKAGIRVFATGGIGGVHRLLEGAAAWDVSADLPALARFPLIVVCAGAKAILDLPATLEYLETWGIPVVGYQTDEFPAFYTRASGLPVGARVDRPEELVSLTLAHWELGLMSAILVVVPPPREDALPAEQAEDAIRRALEDARMEQVSGQALTPFLLGRVSELTGGASLQANLALLRNNALVAAGIARSLAERLSQPPGQAI